MTEAVEISVRAFASAGRDFMEYADKSGRVQRIDLSACAKRFAEAHPGRSSGRCIGLRRIDGRENHLLLFADPPVRIRCASSLLRRRKDTSLLRALCRKINDSGWQTMDMT